MPNFFRGVMYGCLFSLPIWMLIGVAVYLMRSAK